MKLEKFYRNSFIVIAANTITGIISFIFSIVLSRELGTEGLGLYGLIMPIYGLMLCLVSEGLITAVSKTITVYHNKNDARNISRMIKIVFGFIFIWVSFIGFLFFISSNFISSFIINDARSINALKVLCPALFFVPFSAILKGYFYGTSKFKITAIIDIIEKAVRVIVLTAIFAIFLPSDVKGTVTAAYAALTIGESVSFTLLFACYKKYKSKYTSTAYRPQSKIQLLFNTLAISVPLCINGFFSSILSTLTTLILPRRLVSTGLSYSGALSLIGSFSGMALNIIFFPMIILNSMSTVLVPDLSLSLSKKDYWSTEKRIFQVVRIAMLLGISTIVVCQCIPDELGILFYKKADLANYIRFASIPAIFCFMSAPTYGILNGLGRQKTLLKNSLIVSIEELLVIFIFAGIPAINIYGVGISIAATSITSIFLNYPEIKRYCSIKFPIRKIISYLFSGILSYIILKSFNNFITDRVVMLKTVMTIGFSFLLVFSLARAFEGNDEFE